MMMRRGAGELMTKMKQGYGWIFGICLLGLLGALGVPLVQAQTELVLHSFAGPTAPRIA
jgi:hypothetical protein